jgi:hypothetical protein
MIVVGLSGYSGAGKDSVADILVRDYGFTKMAFATPIKEKVEILDPILGYHKEFCCENCDAEIEEVRLSTLLAYGMTQEEIKRDFMYGPELRRVWQYVGTDLFRADDEDYWVKIAERELQQTTAERVVFTDVRFENEADMIFDLRDGLYDEGAGLILEATASVWRIVRPDQHPTDVHVSEQMIGLLGEEVTIVNDGSLEDLKVLVNEAMDVTIDDEIPGQMAFDIEGWEWNDNKSL